VNTRDFDRFGTVLNHYNGFSETLVSDRFRPISQCGHRSLAFGQFRSKFGRISELVEWNRDPAETKPSNQLNGSGTMRATIVKVSNQTKNIVPGVWLVSPVSIDSHLPRLFWQSIPAQWAWSKSCLDFAQNECPVGRTKSRSTFRGFSREKPEKCPYMRSRITFRRNCGFRPQPINLPKRYRRNQQRWFFKTTERFWIDR